jgi:cell division protein FtsI/penicillin-binding protein 2
MLVRKNYKSKLFFVLFAFFFLYAVVLLRLFFIQVHQREFFQLIAKQQYVTEISTHPPRAIIYDRRGEPLVFNKEKLSAFILPKRFSEPKKIKAILRKDFPEIYKKLNKRRLFLWLERRLSEKRLKEIKAYKSSDIYFLGEPQRFYPFPASAYVVGSTDVDNKGIEGIELQYNDRLGGTPTTFILEKDARSGYFYFNRDIKKQGTVGLPVTLTLDHTIQFFAQEELDAAVKKYGAKGGAAVVMNPDSGEIIAMASKPSNNIAVAECFELGSVIKVFTALAALQEGLVTPDEEFDCEGKVTKIDGVRVENWKSLGPGKHPFSLVVARSNNVGIAKVAKRLGPQLYYHLRLLGFGKKTGIRFPGERSGFVNPPYHWSRSSLIVMSFGYEIMVTLLQLARAYSIIANGGYYIEPVLVKDPPRRTITKKRLYDEKIVEQLKDMIVLRDWMKDRFSIQGYKIMGKTGTARSVKDGKYSKKKHVYTYAGIVERGSYKRVIITFIKEPEKSSMWATQIATPLFHKIAEKMVVHDLSKR